ncbi:MAG: hypothetical protein QXG35_09715 [Nitrososphaerota archaeon]
MDEDCMKIVKAVGDEGEATLIKIRERSGLTWYTIYNCVRELAQEGLLCEREKRFPKSRRFYLTEKGRKVYEKLKITESAANAAPVPVDITPYLKQRADATIGYMVPRMREKSFMEKLKILLNFYATVLTLGFFKRFGEKTEDIVKALSVVRSAIFPPVEAEEERGAFAEGVIELLSRLLRCRGFRERVAEKRRLTLILDFDFSGAQLSNEELREALFWAFVFEGLHREGKI